MQEYKRNIDRSVREIEREKTKLQTQVSVSKSGSGGTVDLSLESVFGSSIA